MVLDRGVMAVRHLVLRLCYQSVKTVPSQNNKRSNHKGKGAVTRVQCLTFSIYIYICNNDINKKQTTGDSTSTTKHDLLDKRMVLLLCTVVHRGTTVAIMGEDLVSAAYSSIKTQTNIKLHEMHTTIANAHQTCSYSPSCSNLIQVEQRCRAKLGTFRRTTLRTFHSIKCAITTNHIPASSRTTYTHEQ